MGRRQGLPTYWQSKGGFGTNYGGRPRVLLVCEDDSPDGPNYLKAVDLFNKLVQMDTGTKTEEYRVSACLNSYRTRSLKDRSKLYAFDTAFAPFADQFGDLGVGELDPDAVSEWVASHRAWGAATRSKRSSQLLRVFDWCKAKKLILANPLRDAQSVSLLAKHKPRSRGKEALLSDALMDLIEHLAVAKHRRNEAFLDLVRMLRGTAARPGEILSCEAHNLRGDRIIYLGEPERGYWWKNARKTGKDRQISLTATLAEIARVRAARWPEGPIFRSKQGKVWTRNGLAGVMQRIREDRAFVAQCNVDNTDPKAFKLYNYRHTWLTRYIEGTGDIWGAAKMTGTSVKMIEKHYCHEDKDKMHERFLRYMGTGQSNSNGQK